MAKNINKSLTSSFKGRQKNLTRDRDEFSPLPIKEVEKRKITFSFLFFKQIQNFGIQNQESKWFSGLFERLKSISDKEFDDLVSNPSIKKCLRLHPLNLNSGTSALSKDDFSFIPEEFLPKSEDCEYWQFQVSKANGRIIGFFNNNHTVFYIVFLDPCHNAQLSNYNDYKVRIIEPGISEIDDLRARISKLIDLNKVLEQSCEALLYEGDSIYMCIDKELFAKFDSLMKQGILQTKFQEFLIENL